MRVGFFAPLPPASTGVAEYAAALLAALKKEAARHQGRVEIESAADLALYHIGNNHLHLAIYQRAIERPGVAVLHDAVLQHFFLGTLGEAGYIEEFVYNYGEWTRGLAADLWRQRARSAADPRYFEYPMLKRIATASRAVIVHNPAAARLVKSHAPEAEVIEIPHLFTPPELPDPVETLRFRAALGLGPRTLLAGVFGHLRESKRLPVVLRAMERAWKVGADARLLVAGAFASSDLERALKPLLAHPRILRTGHLPEKDFWRHAAAIDLCVNLRFPTAGESSGIAIRMMGIGKPVVFTTGDEIARIPGNACLRVDVGAAEEETLAGIVLWLAGDREAAVEIGKRAAAHIAQEHALETVAERYWSALARLHETSALVQR
jgi:glycosyltransferase involved in cell wall biosynthesis